MAKDRSHDTTLGNHQLRPETLMLSYGYDPALSEGSAKPPVFLTSTFVFRSAEEGADSGYRRRPRAPDSRDVEQASVEAKEFWREVE